MSALPEHLPATPAESLPAAGLVSTSTIDAQMRHRTIRAFTDAPVDEATIATLIDVARHAPTSGFYQQATLLCIKDPALRQVVYEASLQPYVGGDRGELFVFVVDLARGALIRQAGGRDCAPLESTALFLQGLEDTLLAAQNMAVAAESLGLGTCFLGSIGGDPDSLIDALRLPKYTFPLVGMLVGHPNQQPQLKPRLPREITTAVDIYPDVDAPAYQAALSEYDEVIQTYYDLREGGKRQDSFTSQICTKPGNGRAEKTDVLAVLRRQGLCLR